MDSLTSGQQGPTSETEPRAGEPRQKGIQRAEEEHLYYILYFIYHILYIICYMLYVIRYIYLYMYGTI